MAKSLKLDCNQDDGDYTEGMKTAISMPDPTFESAERLGISCSRLYSEAVAEYVARHDPSTLTDRINAVCDEVDTKPHAFVGNAARRILVAGDW